jgi:hypothetical protein
MKTKCTNCETEFETTFDTKKYCSNTCKQEHFYKRKFNINNVAATSQEQRNFTEISPDNNKHLFNENIINENRPRTEETNGYLQKYIETIQLNCSLQSKLDIANYMLQQKEQEEEQEDEEDDFGEGSGQESEQAKFYKTLNGLLPLALSKFLNNGTTKKPV